MTRNYYPVIYFIICLIFGSGCSGKSVGETDPVCDSIGVPELSDMTLQAKMMADSILNSLSLEEKVGQSIMPSLYSESDFSTLELVKRLIEKYHIGGIVLLKGDLESARKISELCSESSVPLFISIDAEWGLGMRLKDAPKIPRNGRIVKEADETLMFDYGREVADECRATGINMVLGPVVDLSGLSIGVIGSRSFGKDPRRTADLGVAYAKGLESGGVISVAKHFPGHGGSRTDSHYSVAKVYKTISEMDTLDFFPFQQYINSGLTGVMAGHIEVRSLTPTGEPAAVSTEILTGLLREEMGFTGLVLTDAFNMGGAKGFSGSQAIKAGADIILCPSDIPGVIEEILDRIDEGDFPIEIIDDRCHRILFTKALFGLWDRSNSYEPINFNLEKIVDLQQKLKGHID